MGYRANINCIYNDSHVWCTNKNIKRSLFGFGARLCLETNGSCDSCEHKKKHKRPKKSPPKPPKEDKLCT
jgi:hypothetical protein